MYFYSVLRTRKLLYFTTVNPSIPLAGFFGEHKDEILNVILSEYKPKTRSYKRGQVTHEAILKDFSFPLIAKPNVGERGYEVVLIRDDEVLKEYIKKDFDFIVQEFIDEPIELGVLYHRLPNSKTGYISSLTLKEYMTVRGDGSSTVYELLLKHPRHFLYAETLSARFPKRMHLIPERDLEYTVHRIGNHCLGTQFIDIGEKVTPNLVSTLDKIADAYEGFHYGRFDLKVTSYDALSKGEGLKIFEMNGISSEPGHMYDMPTVFHAYKTLYIHWNYILRISLQNIKKGVEPTPFTIFFKQVYRHFIT